MKTNDNYSFIEKCIHALPPEKQESARQAFLELGEGDGSAISQLLVVLESNAAFAATIPAEMSVLSEKFIREITEVQTRATKERSEAEAQLTRKLGDLIRQQIPAMGKAMAVDRLASEAEEHKHCLTRVERSITRLRHLRVGGVLILMLVGIVMVDGIIAAALWQRVQTGLANERFLARLDRAGIELRLIPQSNGLTRFQIEGPAYRGTAWRLDEQDKIKGVDLVIKETH